MSTVSDSLSSSAKKRPRNAIWDMYDKEEDSHGEIKWKCSECQERLSNHPTSVSRHWEFQHKEKKQPKKLRPQISEDTATLNSRDSRVHRAFVDVLSIPCMSVNLMLHPLSPSSFNTLESMLTNQLETVEQALKADLKKTARRFSRTYDELRRKPDRSFGN
uniref:BED-type domain-containing protein n=1 Tax=Ditylenchus dipsaci TaxID=166011 RepID=A0A915CMR3_9BILA